MANLIVDIGNTRIKLAVFDNDKKQTSLTVDSLDTCKIDQLKSMYKTLDCAIFSTVRNNSEQILQLLKSYLPYTIELNHKTLLPVTNNYETPETLGKDRIAAVVGANFVHAGCDVLVIDAGTAITYDYIDKNAQYNGGYITPGLNMRFKALNHFTEKLPLLNVNNPKISDGTNTTLSITGGINHGLKGEVESVISYFSRKSDKLYIILTGGDTNYFEKLLKSYNFVALDITLIGLNRILEFNKKTNN